MDNIDYMDRVLQVTQLSVCVLEFTANVFGKMPQMSSAKCRKCLRQNATNVFGKMPQMSSARIENGCESSIMMYIFF